MMLLLFVCYTKEPVVPWVLNTFAVVTQPLNVKNVT